MKNKAFGAFIREFLALVLCIVVIFGLVRLGFVTIQIQPNFLVIAAIIIYGGFFVFYLSGVANRGIRAIIDMITGKTVQVQGTIVFQKPFRASSLAATSTKDRAFNFKTYWIILIKTKSGNHSILSSEPIAFLDGSKCNFVVGHSSSIVVSVSPLTQHGNTGEASLEP